MTSLVLDCSIAVAWCFEDEITPEIDALADRVRVDGAVVPSLWHLEVGNVLLQAVRRGRITPAELQSRIEALAELPIAADEDTARRAWREVLSLARAERLTTYDAAYLELASRRGLPLATKDADLRAAAQRLGVPLLPG
jgi:predicted nucleic acid-binding protein